MNYRTLNRSNLQVSEIGYGMWGIAGGEGGWSDTDDDLQDRCLDRAVELGCNFFDTAWIYGRGSSEKLLGRLLKRHPDKKLIVADKIPPKNTVWPSKRNDQINNIFPVDHIFEYVDKSLCNLDMPCIDILLFHVWEDSWASEDSWQKAITKIKDEGMARSIGISVNRWEAWNVIETLKTGLIDSVQVIYNVFDQAPEDELFGICQELDVAVIARVPFDEGTLTGQLTLHPTWPANDWRNSYFVAENLVSSVRRANRLKEALPPQNSLPNVALKFILHHPAVTTVIPGMRKVEHVESNMGVSDEHPLDAEMLGLLRQHRWDREPTWWSQ